MEILLIALRIYEFIIIARVLLSWINTDPHHPVVEWIHRLTEPVLAPIRSLLPTERIGLDLSPLIVLVLIQVLERVLLNV
jgi:YggT family protein